MAIGRWVGALLVGAALLAGCPLDVVGSGSWELEMITPDERGLFVWFGTSDGLDSFSVTEEEDAVTIDVRVRTVLAPGGGEFRFDSRFVELDEPLGDRELRGCKRDDCREFLFDLASPGGPIVIAPETIASGYPGSEQHHFDRRTGELLANAEPVDVPVSPGAFVSYPAGVPGLEVWIEQFGLHVQTQSREPVWSTSLLVYELAPIMADELVVVAAEGPDDRGPRIIAFDVRTADVRWEYGPFAGTFEAAGDSQLVTLAVPEGEIDSSELVALDLKTGEERWRTDLRAAIGNVQATATELFVSIHEGVVSLDPATGDIVWWSQVAAGLWTPPD